MNTPDKPQHILGIVGIRSGSRGIPHKNIKHLAGKPLIAWILEAARKSKIITRLIVSTDSSHYAEVARQYGAETPFLRPQELAADSSPEFEYIKHALQWLKEHEEYEPDIVVRLVATSPLQEAEDIDACIEKLITDQEAHSSVVIAEARQHPLKAFKIQKDKDVLVPYFGGNVKDMGSNRQGFEKAYFRANIVASRMKTIMETDSPYGDRIRYHIIPEERAIDIDNPFDFFVAEQILRKIEEEK